MNPDVNALIEFAEKKNTFLDVVNSSGKKHLVAVQRNWLGRWWMWICSAFCCGSPSLKKVVKYLTSLQNPLFEKTSRVQPGLEKLIDKISKYNVNNDASLHHEYEVIQTWLNSNKSLQTSQPFAASTERASLKGLRITIPPYSSLPLEILDESSPINFDLEEDTELD